MIWAGKNVDVDVTVVIVSYNTAHLLNRLFAALEAAKAGLTIQIIVVDNASRDGSVEILRSQFPGVWTSRYDKLSNLIRRASLLLYSFDNLARILELVKDRPCQIRTSHRAGSAG